MDARTGSIRNTPLEAPIAGSQVVSPAGYEGFLAAFLLGLIAVTVLQDIYLSWRQQYRSDPPTSRGAPATSPRCTRQRTRRCSDPEFCGIPNVTVS